MPRLERIESIRSSNGGLDDLFLVASSFEPRSIRASMLLPEGAFARSVIFNYEDTLDSVVGRHNTRQIRGHLTKACGGHVHTLPCYFVDPYSAVRAFSMLVAHEPWAEALRTVTIDATCFTKIHLLLLLQYLHIELRATKVRVCYTEPLSYATAFGKALSHGIEKTVYLPYQPARHESSGVGLVAFLGYERLRLERIVQELEPDISVVVFGQPGFVRSMEDYSRHVNKSLIHRATYDDQYRLVNASARDPFAVAEVLREEVTKLRAEGCDSIYLAALGTKLQALGIDLLRRLDLPVRLLLAYSIPRRYERRMYSQGSGPTYLLDLYREAWANP